jgi:hypothetical protein
VDFSRSEKIRLIGEFNAPQSTALPLAPALSPIARDTSGSPEAIAGDIAGKNYQISSARDPQTRRCRK